MLFLDNAAPDSCCAERPLHIPTYPRLVSTAATVREKTWEQIHTHTHRPTDYNNPSLRMRARGLIIMYWSEIFVGVMIIVLIPSDLSWSHHLHAIYSKARKLLDVLYR